MDLRLLAGVFWRFRVVIAVGAVLALALAFLSYARLSFSGGSIDVKHRESILYTSSTKLFVTQPGFPWGRAVNVIPAPTPGTPYVQSADPSRFANLAVLYAELATSDPVLRILQRGGPISGQITARPVVDAQNESSLPIIEISVVSASAPAAVNLARRATNAFIRFIHREQDASKIAPSQRVVVEVIQRPRGTAIIKGPSKTIPLVVFIAGMASVLGLALVLENVRPRLRPVANDDAVPPVSKAHRSVRSA